MSEILYLDKGRVTIPKECRERHGLGDGTRLEFFETRSGAMMLKPLSRPKLDLADHLARFAGVEIPERPVHCPPRA